MAGGLGVPLERHLATGRGCHVRLHVCGGFVADDVGTGKGVWGDEAVIEIVAWPTRVAGTRPRYSISALQPVSQTPLATVPVHGRGLRRGALRVGGQPGRLIVVPS